MALRLTAAEMAEESGLPLCCVSNLERGRGKRTIEALRPNAGVLHSGPWQTFSAEVGQGPRTSRLVEGESGDHHHTGRSLTSGAEHGRQSPIREGVLADHARAQAVTCRLFVSSRDFGRCWWGTKSPHQPASRYQNRVLTNQPGTVHITDLTTIKVDLLADDLLTMVTERRMSQVMSEPGGLHHISVQATPGSNFVRIILG